MKQFYIKSADILFTDNDGEYEAYFFEERMTVIIRTQDIGESFIFFAGHASSENLMEAAVEQYDTGEYEVLSGDIEYLRKRGH